MTLDLEVVAPGAAQRLQATPDAGHEPATTNEKYLAVLWSEVIGLRQVLLSHKFVRVGGNSLTLNIILTRIETEKGATLDPQLFFDDDRSSLFELARELDAALERRPGGSM